MTNEKTNKSNYTDFVRCNIRYDWFSYREIIFDVLTLIGILHWVLPIVVIALIIGMIAINYKLLNREEK